MQWFSGIAAAIRVLNFRNGLMRQQDFKNKPHTNPLKMTRECSVTIAIYGHILEMDTKISL